jgi:hypothetical protein
MTPDAARHAAANELEVHQAADRSHREAAARRASAIDDLLQMFGSTLRLATASSDEG